MLAVVVVTEASSSSGVLILVPQLEFGLPKAFLLRENLCFYHAFSYNPLLFVWNPTDVVVSCGGGRESCSGLNVHLLAGECLWAATFTGVHPVAFPLPHALMGTKK